MSIIAKEDKYVNKIRKVPATTDDKLPQIAISQDSAVQSNGMEVKKSINKSFKFLNEKK